jgi:hypothetical protein
MSRIAQHNESVNRLLAATLKEVREFYHRENDQRRREQFARELDEHDRKRWGYPPLRSRQWRRSWNR